MIRKFAFGALSFLMTVSTLAPAASLAVGAKTLARGRKAETTMAFGLVAPPPPIAKNDGRGSEHVAALFSRDPEVEAPPVEKATVSASAPSKPSSYRAAAVITAAATEPEAPQLADLDAETLREALGRQIETLPICQRDDGPTGPGTAEVLFHGNGTAQVALSDPYARTQTGACIGRRLAGAARRGGGPPVALRVQFTL